MMTLTLVLFGLISLSSLKVNLLPDLSYPTLTVRTDYTGAAPSEIETLISQPAEEALGVVKGLRKLKSISRTGQSDVVLEFAWGTDMDQAGLDVRDKMETLQLPLEPSRRCCCASIRPPSRSCAWRCRRSRMAAARPMRSAS
jgi:HAE1 family hydrophobic/amphiphilic exporter-1